jgi:hypothetical protein
MRSISNSGSTGILANTMTTNLINNYPSVTNLNLSNLTVENSSNDWESKLF